MADNHNIRKIGAAALLGASVVIIPVGCDMVPTGSGEATSSAQDAAYQKALQSKSAADVTGFIEAYKGSSQSADLLNAMPAATLANVPRSSVLGLSSSVQRRLDYWVQNMFGLTKVGESSDGSNGRSGS
ncbi:hypothetical protein AB0T83_15175 [Fluviibacterium sp. DFM31]|uniref:Uncharacterized protein n=1 Tax=Meridianimarinicoccus marinus TaxID=3231483 RepID=A0ABV3LCF5_9RHOB